MGSLSKFFDQLKVPFAFFLFSFLYGQEIVKNTTNNKFSEINICHKKLISNFGDFRIMKMHDAKFERSLTKDSGFNDSIIICYHYKLRKLNRPGLSAVTKIKCMYPVNLLQLFTKSLGQI